MYNPYNAYNQVQNAAGEFVAPTAGVGYGGQGVWINKHFATIEEARVFFDSQISELLNIYGRGKYQISRSCLASLVDRFSIVNIKKNGKPGKAHQTVQMYRIIEEQRAREEAR
jgi:hypothetical protein